MALPEHINDREYGKFCENALFEIGVRTCSEIINTAANPIPVEIISGAVSGLATTPTIYNLSAPLANTEVSQALSAGTKKILIRVRGLARSQFAFVLGDSGLNFITIPPGATYNEESLSLSGKTVYIQTNKAAQIIEILQWV